MNKREQARRLLKFYLRQAYTAAGLRWDSDNDSEIDEIVDLIISAAVEESTTPARTPNADYVLRGY